MRRRKCRKKENQKCIFTYDWQNDNPVDHSQVWDNIEGASDVQLTSRLYQMHISTYSSNGQLLLLVQRVAHPKLSSEAVTIFAKLLLRLSKTKKNNSLLAGILDPFELRYIDFGHI